MSSFWKYFIVNLLLVLVVGEVVYITTRPAVDGSRSNLLSANLEERFVGDVVGVDTLYKKYKKVAAEDNLSSSAQAKVALENKLGGMKQTYDGTAALNNVLMKLTRNYEKLVALTEMANRNQSSMGQNKKQLETEIGDLEKETQTLNMTLIAITASGG